MVRRISDKEIELMERLFYDKSLSIAQIASEVSVSFGSAYGYTRAKERGFASPNDYKSFLAKRMGFNSYGEYRESLAHKNGFKSERDYRNFLFRQRGFRSSGEYLKFIANRRKAAPLNAKFSDLIKRRLKEVEKTQKWLSEQIGVTKRSVEGYVSGEHLPEESVQERIFLVLGLSYKNLKDLEKRLDS